MSRFTKLLIVCVLGSPVLSGCTVAKLEARIEANPQCKEVMNPKTGALMPCPGTDKSFYRSVGLEPPKASVPPSAVGAVGIANSSTSPEADGGINANAAGLAKAPSSASNTNLTTKITTQPDCKPQLHKKTGGMLPCPSPD